MLVFIKINYVFISCFEPKDYTLQLQVTNIQLNLFVILSIFLLKCPLSKIKSYVKDHFDFLKKCKRNLIKNSKLVFFSVTSLYTNIPHELGLKAIKYWWDKSWKYNTNYIIRIVVPWINTTDSILEVLKLVLKNNHFVYNE